MFVMYSHLINPICHPNAVAMALFVDCWEYSHWFDRRFPCLGFECPHEFSFEPTWCSRLLILETHLVAWSLGIEETDQFKVQIPLRTSRGTAGGDPGFLALLWIFLAAKKDVRMPQLCRQLLLPASWKWGLFGWGNQRSACLAELCSGTVALFRV